MQTVGEPGVGGVCGEAIGVEAGVVRLVWGEGAEVAGIVVMMVVMVAVGGAGLSVAGFIVGCGRVVLWMLDMGDAASDADVHFEAQSCFGGEVEGGSAAGVVRHGVFFVLSSIGLRQIG